MKPLDEEFQAELPATAHARRASTTVAGRFAQQTQPTPLPDAHADRTTGILRRLSLSGPAFSRVSALSFLSPAPHCSNLPFPTPQPNMDSTPTPSMPNPPPNSAVSPVAQNVPFERKPRRSATISSPDSSRRRAPSPMGERILKGHFDGFN
jgi:hypothetical protein